MALSQRDFRKDKPKPLRVRRVCGENEIVSLSCRAQSRHLVTKGTCSAIAARFLHTARPERSRRDRNDRQTER